MVSASITRQLNGTDRTYPAQPAGNLLQEAASLAASQQISVYLHLVRLRSLHQKTRACQNTNRSQSMVEDCVPIFPFISMITGIKMATAAMASRVSSYASITTPASMPPISIIT